MTRCATCSKEIGSGTYKMQGYTYYHLYCYTKKFGMKKLDTWF